MANLTAVKEKIVPVRFNPKTIKKDFKTLAKLLMDIKGTDWKVREKEILKLAGMSLEHKIEDKEFAEHFQRELCRAMSEQILDLRSQIVKAACAVVVVLVEELDAHLDTSIEQLLPSLLKQLPVKAQPIRDSAHDCISCLLAHHTNPKIFRPLFNASTEKEKIIRGRVAEYLAYICENWEQVVLQKNLGPLLGNLKPMLQDGSEVVREYSRQCVITLAPEFPHGVTELLSTVDSKVVRMMESDLPEEVMSGLQELGPRRSGGAALPVPPRQSGNIRRSTGSYGAPQVERTRLSGGPARVASTPHYDDLDPNRGARNGGTARSVGSSGPRRQPVQPRQRAATATDQSMRQPNSQGKAAAIAGMGNVQDNNNYGLSSTDPGDLLNRLQHLRTEVLRISAARS